MANQPLIPVGGFIYLLLANLCTSTISIAVKIGLRQGTSALEFVVFRVVLAALILWLYLLCFRPNFLRIDRAGIIGCVKRTPSSRQK